MFDFLGLGRFRTSSKDIAKERLKTVVLNDRVNLSPRLMGLIKSDVAKVLASYMEIEEGMLTMTLSRGTDGGSNLVMEAPVRKFKHIGKGL